MPLPAIPGLAEYMPNTDRLWTIDEIKDANRRHGLNWFSADSMRFFRSRISRTVYQGAGGVFFVSSERFVGSNGVPAPRKYTVRQFNPETGAIDTVSAFNELPEWQAHRIAQIKAGVR
jgi:hypothetical protein